MVGPLFQISGPEEVLDEAQEAVIVDFLAQDRH